MPHTRLSDVLATTVLPEIDPRDAPTLALLGHDLRAALSEVIGGLRLIDSSALPATPRAQIARSRAASEALALLLEQALTLLMGYGPTGDRPTPMIRTERLIAGIRLRWEGASQSRGSTFALHAAPDLPVFLSVDAALIERVMANLLGNALKYAAGGHISCALSLQAGRFLQIRVTDDGPGFSEAVLPRLFQDVVHTDAATMPGTGLGLRSVSAMVHHAGGSIAVRNLAPRGAEVVVQLPVAQLSDDATDCANPASLPDLSTARILVADDNETSRHVLAMLLAQMGAEVVTVADGVEAIGRIERESFDALLIDIEMPRFSGLDVIRYLRSMPGPVASMPILAVTAYWLRANREAIEAAGADSVLSKPDLTATILGNALVTALRPSAAPAIALDTKDAPHMVDSAQFERLLKSAGPAVAAELLDRLLDDLQSAERGLLAAARVSNWQGIREQTHVMIALAGTVGASRLQRLSTSLNTLAHQPLPDRGTFMTLLPETLEALDVLIHFVSQQSPPKREQL